MRSTRYLKSKKCVFWFTLLKHLNILPIFTSFPMATIILSRSFMLRYRRYSLIIIGIMGSTRSLWFAYSTLSCIDSKLSYSFYFETSSWRINLSISNHFSFALYARTLFHQAYIMRHALNSLIRLYLCTWAINFYISSNFFISCYSFSNLSDLTLLILLDRLSIWDCIILFISFCLFRITI